MSFLTEVLSSVEQTDLESRKINLPIISAKIISCKQEINKFVDDVYYKFSEWPRRNKQLLDATTQLSTEIDNLQSTEQATIRDLEKKAASVNDLSVELEKSNIALRIVIRLVQAHELLITVADFYKKSLYVKAGLELIRVDECVASIPKDEITNGITALNSKIMLEKAVLTDRILDILRENVKTSQTKVGGIETNSVKIKTKGKALPDVILILAKFDGLLTTLNKFSNFFWESVCKPIITSIVTIKIEDENGFHTLTIAVKKSTAKKSYTEVFSKLVEVFSFLHAHFNYAIDDSTKTMQFIGNNIKYDLSETILKTCVSHAVPSSDENCASYEEVIAAMKEFQNKLVELDVFEAEINPILGYANNMDLVFINKKCQEYLTSAINLMKKDLHDLVDVGVVHEDASSPLTADEFPASSVSRSTIEILELAQRLLQQAVNESEVSAGRMICTVQSIFYQYGNIVYGHHERFVLTIPQHVALFRNNCMYIAHQLTQLNMVYTKQFPHIILNSLSLFPDQGHQLQTMGGEIFLGFVDAQVKQMECTLEEAQYNSVSVSEELHQGTDKYLRQCMRQYEILRTVWLKVLPLSVYNKTLGYLFNTFCKKLIEIVMGAEDIPSKNAELLVEMYKVILNRGPKLFTDPQEITLYVEQWQKLNDLMFILSSSLVDIKDRWADGKGPLTLTFTAEEVRELIKALFQNTDRRATVLSKIHS